MATKKAPAQRVADLKARFTRIKTAILAVDALTADYLDRTAADLEGFAVELGEITKPQGETPPPN